MEFGVGEHTGPVEVVVQLVEAGLGVLGEGDAVGHGRSFAGVSMARIVGHGCISGAMPSE